MILDSYIRTSPNIGEATSIFITIALSMPDGLILVQLLSINFFNGPLASQSK